MPHRLKADSAFHRAGHHRCGESAASHQVYQEHREDGQRDAKHDCVVVHGGVRVEGRRPGVGRGGVKHHQRLKGTVLLRQENEVGERCDKERQNHAPERVEQLRAGQQLKYRMTVA